MRNWLAIGSVLFSLSAVLIAVVGFVLVVLIGRLAGDQELTLYVFVLSCLTWIEQSVCRFVAQTFIYYGSNRPSCLDVLLRRGAPLLIGITAILTATAIVACLLHGFTSPEADGRLWLAMAVALTDIPLLLAYCILDSLHRIQKHLLFSALALKTYALAKLLAVGGVVLCGGGTVAALAANTCSTIAGLAVLCFRLDRKNWPQNRSYRGTEILSWVVQFGFSSSLVVSLVYAATNFDLWALSALGITRQTAGYASAFALSRAPLSLGAGLFAGLVPALARHDIASAEIISTIRRAYRMLGLVLIPFAAIVASQAEGICQLCFGSNSTGAGIFLAIQIWTTTVSAFAILSITILRSRGYIRLPLILSLVSVSVLALCTLLAAYTAHAVGVTTTLAVGILATTSLFGVLVHVELSVPLPIRDLLHIVLIASAVATVGLAWQPAGLAVVVWSAVLLGGFIATWWATGGTKEEDKALLRRLFRSRNPNGLS